MINIFLCCCSIICRELSDLEYIPLTVPMKVSSQHGGKRLAFVTGSSLPDGVRGVKQSWLSLKGVKAEAEREQQG